MEGGYPSSVSYCIAFSSKIKEIFASDPDFFAKCRRAPDRNRQQMESPGQRIRPKLPHRTQQHRQQSEKQHAAAQQSQQYIQPGDALHAPEQKQKHRQQRRQAVGAVGEPGEAGMAQAQGPQQVIEQGDAAAQQDGLAECQQLNGDLIFHISRTGGAAVRPGTGPLPHRRWRPPGRPHGALRPPETAVRCAAPRR